MAASSAEKMRRYRRRMRERGLRPVQVWVPDLSDPEVRERIRQEVDLLRNHPSSREGDAFLEAALAEIEGWEA